MDKNAIRDELLSYHHPEFLEIPEGGDGAHVCQVWEDGEVTSTKGGSLLGQRRMIMIVPPTPVALPVDLMPHRSGDHGCVVCRYADYEKVRAVILNALEYKE
jgi:hypothetical protein